MSISEQVDIIEVGHGNPAIDASCSILGWVNEHVAGLSRLSLLPPILTQHFYV